MARVSPLRLAGTIDGMAFDPIVISSDGAGPHVVNATLSLIVDPPASVDFFPLPNGIETPDLGAGSAAIPEPATMTLLGVGLAGLIAARRRRTR